MSRKGVVTRVGWDSEDEEDPMLLDDAPLKDDEVEVSLPPPSFTFSFLSLSLPLSIIRITVWYDLTSFHQVEWFHPTQSLTEYKTVKANKVM